MAQNEQQIMDMAIDQVIKNDAELAAKVAHDDKIIAQSTSQAERLAAIRDKQAIRKKIADSDEIKSEEQKQKELAQKRDQFLSHMASMQNSHNKLMASIGKAAAIAQIWINTGEAASAGSKWGFTMGGPPLAAAFSALAWAAGAAQVARVAGVQLAEGGVVMPRPGGTQATIGEAGQPEAVIPLDKAGDMGFGGGMTINFNGPIMGNEAQAEEFARAIDRQLLKLRRSNQSVAFETDVT